MRTYDRTRRIQTERVYIAGSITKNVRLFCVVKTELKWQNNSWMRGEILAKHYEVEKDNEVIKISEQKAAVLRMKLGALERRELDAKKLNRNAYYGENQKAAMENVFSDWH